MKDRDNYVDIVMRGHSMNEAFARVAVSAFITPVDPSVGDLTDIKTAVSEAVTNAIIHGYTHKEGDVRMKLGLCERLLTIEISDTGEGIEDVAQAREPLYTSKPEMERSGMGFTVMESFMDTVEVRSEKGRGTCVVMTKQLGR